MYNYSCTLFRVTERMWKVAYPSVQLIGASVQLIGARVQLIGTSVFFIIALVIRQILPLKVLMLSLSI